MFDWNYTNKSNKSKTRYNYEQRKHIEMVDDFVQKETILVKNQFKKSVFGEKLSEFEVKERVSGLWFKISKVLVSIVQFINI